MVTIQDVAKAAGVSAMTVSNVINDRVPVRPTTRTRVLDAIETLGYRVNLAARNLRVGRTGTVGLAVPDLDKPYIGQLATRVIRAGAEHGLRVVVEETGARRQSELDAIAQSRLRLYDGLLISAVEFGSADLEQMTQSAPIVLLGEHFTGSVVDHVGMPNVTGSRAVVEHLIQTGRTRIAVVGAPPVDSPPDDLGAGPLRVRGYREALAAAGIPYTAALVRESSWTMDGAQEAIQTLLREGVDFDAVFALTDSLAIATIRALADAAIDVPRQVAVAGFDNILEARYSVPRLTTVAPDHDAMARTAMEFLVERIESGAQAGPGRDVTSEFEVIVRESTIEAA